MMIDNGTWVLIITAGFALIFGPLTARSSMRREPIHGGIVAQILNFLASIAMMAVVPGVLASIILGHNAGFAIVLGVILMLICYLLLVGFAVVEKAPREAYLASRKPKEDKGWTAEDALKSGL